jgi:integrase
LLALLLAYGLRRHELADLTVAHLQQREGTGRLLTYVERLVTFEPSPSPIGFGIFWTNG